MPLPQSIDRDIYDRVYALLSTADQAIANAWYTLDENSLHPKYYLKELESLSDRAYWNSALPILRSGYDLNNMNAE